MVSPLSTALLLAAVVSPSQAAIAAWWNGIGPQIILQNTTTGAIRHSPCNSYKTAYYSNVDGSELPLDYKPKNGTALAGVGYWNELTTIASVYYVEKNGRLANALLECNMKTGLFRSKGNWIISGEDNTVHNNTSLAALLLGAAGGYRVYYNDADMAINEMGYTDDSGWAWNGFISKDPQASPALGAFFTGKDNITVASIRDTQNIEAIRYNSDRTWRISTFPQTLAGNIITQETNATSFAINQTVPINFTMPAWDGKSKSLGVSIDSEYTRSVWYIGSDKSLYSVRNKNFTWGMQTNQSDAFWPLADSPGAEFGIASEFKSSMVRIYYFVKDQLAEIKYEKGEWKAWKALATPPKADVTQSPTSPLAPEKTSSTTQDAGAVTAETGLSSGAKAGIAVGVVLGVIALCALGAAFYLMRKRKAAPIDPEPPAGYNDQHTPVLSYGSHAPPQDMAYHDWEKQNGVSPQYPMSYPAQLDSSSPPVQLDATARATELSTPSPMYELVGDANHQRHQAL